MIKSPETEVNTQPMFDVFLAHNSVDKPQVRAIAKELKRRGLKPWLDEEQIPPGRSFQQEIEQAIPLVKSAAIFIGSEGLGRWQVWELRSLISQCVEEEIPVIPVLLPGVDGIPERFRFLQEFNWVSFASGIDNLESLGRLVWGITGCRPDNTNNENAIAQYCQKVEEFAADGEISVTESFILEDLEKNLGLAPEKTRVIRDQVLELYGRYQEKLDQYRQFLTKLVAEQGYLLEDKAKADLRRLQDYLQLRDEDVATIEARILPSLPKPPLDKFLCRFEFDVVTVNNCGEEIKREHRHAKYFSEDLGNGVELEMVAIPGGEVVMGSPEGEGQHSEKPQHRVTVPPFFMGKYPVTQEQWKAVVSLPQVNYDLKPNPSRFFGDNRPVECIHWYEAVEFCQRLSEQTGREYRLPSEAEWEYACRAGTTTPFHFGETITDKLATYDNNEDSDKMYDSIKDFFMGFVEILTVSTSLVGIFSPNTFGLYDMHGNVLEWCADNWHGNYKGAPVDGRAWLSGESDTKVLRGGSWKDSLSLCRSASRRTGSHDIERELEVSDSPLDLRDSAYGFRVVCVDSRNT